MKNDNDEERVNQQPQYTEDPGATGKRANSNGHETKEPRLGAAAEAFSGTG